MKDNASIESFKLQAISLFLLILLSFDTINPVKTLGSAFDIDSYLLGVGFAVTFVFVIWYHAADALYFVVRVFCHSIMSIFFKSIDIIGEQNVPQEGPVIFVGNHSNQFVDGLVVMINCNRKAGFLVAEKSFNIPVLRFLLNSIGCIAVSRPQDSVKVGTGTVSMEEGEKFVLVGQGTKFTEEIGDGDQVRHQGKTVKDSGSPVRVIKVIDDTHLELESNLLDSNGKAPKGQTFGIFKKINQSETFQNVYEHLRKGSCIGIFPEGGSHDRTDLLPLKAGVALMAFGVKDKYHINAHVVPVGLNYFRGHRFRGRVVLEFGSPLHVDNELMKQYREDKRSACNEFLLRVEEGMRSVIVTAPDYNALQLVYTARRLYQPSGIRLSAKVTQDLNRRFAEGYKLLVDKAASDAAKGDNKIKDSLHSLESKLLEYRKTLRLMGLTDHQVPYIQWWGFHDVLSSAIYSLFIFVLASIPSFILNAPVGLLARHVAKKEQKRALAGSKVKILARDVMLSKKMLFSVVAVPSLWVFYLVLAIVFTNWQYRTIFLLFWSCPIFSYFGVRAVEAGIIEMKNIRPLFYRLLPKYKAIQDHLPIRRAELQLELRSFVKEHKDTLGELAEKKPMDWKAYMHAVKEKEALMNENNPDASNGDDDEKTDQNKVTEKHDLSFLRKNTRSSLNLPGIVEEESEATKTLLEKKTQ